MAKLERAIVVQEALELLDEVGLDKVSTRALARRLGIEQPSLYWHFRNKSELLSAMAEAAMRSHAQPPLPTPGEDWREWFIENSRSFRRTLLARRDGARLHAGSMPQDGDFERGVSKLRFLVTSGLPEADAATAMLTSGRFTVGSVLEEQTEADRTPVTPTALPGSISHSAAFEAGLRMILHGLEQSGAVTND